MRVIQRISVWGVLAATLPLAACTSSHDLIISEVGVDAVELYLHEPPSHTLALRGQSLVFECSNGDTGTLDLSGRLNGREYLVIWAQPGYTGAPVSAPFTDFFNRRVPGIKVREDFFGSQPAGAGFAYRVSGSRFRYVFPFFYTYDETDNLVRFGPVADRPNLGGTFSEDGSLANVTRSPRAGQTQARTLRRHTNPAAGTDIPQNTDQELDWREDDESFGEAK